MSSHPADRYRESDDHIRRRQALREFSDVRRGRITEPRGNNDGNNNNGLRANSQRRKSQASGNNDNVERGANSNNNRSNSARRQPSRRSGSAPSNNRRTSQPQDNAPSRRDSNQQQQSNSARGRSRSRGRQGASRRDDYDDDDDYQRNPTQQQSRGGRARSRGRGPREADNEPTASTASTSRQQPKVKVDPLVDFKKDFRTRVKHQGAPTESDLHAIKLGGGGPSSRYVVYCSCCRFHPDSSPRSSTAQFFGELYRSDQQQTGTARNPYDREAVMVSFSEDDTFLASAKKLKQYQKDLVIVSGEAKTLRDEDLPHVVSADRAKYVVTPRGLRGFTRLDTVLKGASNSPFGALDAAKRIALCRALLLEARKMHNMGLLHRGLQPEGVFCKPSVADGCIVHFSHHYLPGVDAPMKKQKGEGEPLLGPIGWSLPTASKESRLATVKSDYWGLGLLCYEILCGRSEHSVAAAATTTAATPSNNSSAAGEGAAAPPPSVASTTAKDLFRRKLPSYINDVLDTEDHRRASSETMRQELYGALCVAIVDGTDRLQLQSGELPLRKESPVGRHGYCWDLAKSLVNPLLKAALEKDDEADAGGATAEGAEKPKSVLDVVTGSRLVLFDPAKVGHVLSNLITDALDLTETDRQRTSAAVIDDDAEESDEARHRRENAHRPKEVLAALGHVVSPDGSAENFVDAISDESLRCVARRQLTLAAQMCGGGKAAAVVSAKAVLLAFANSGALDGPGVLKFLLAADSLTSALEQILRDHGWDGQLRGKGKGARFRFKGDHLEEPAQRKKKEEGGKDEEPQSENTETKAENAVKEEEAATN